MNEPTKIKQNNNRIQRSLKKLKNREETILLMLDKALWLEIEKREAIKMMIEIFMGFAQELSRKKGWK